MKLPRLRSFSCKHCGTYLFKASGAYQPNGIPSLAWCPTCEEYIYPIEFIVEYTTDEAT